VVVVENYSYSGGVSASEARNFQRLSLNQSGLIEHQKRYKVQARSGAFAVTAQTSMLHIRVDDDIKEQATQALTAMGLSVSDAVRLFLRRVVIDQRFRLNSRCQTPRRSPLWRRLAPLMVQRRAL